MDGGGDDIAAAARPLGDVLCGTLFLLPGANALSPSVGEGPAKGKASSYAFG
ncbi:hypothetical protein ACRQ5Q_15760 [Bradyrhizobium sp. PMVTL-01]|jgi:hypothetical protein|uniref:hypothetical protein n=1 Tax=unclassified Bradyrhizobium TaxID=2631580 RepID=UPI003F6F25FC